MRIKTKAAFKFPFSEATRAEVISTIKHLAKDHDTDFDAVRKAMNQTSSELRDGWIHHIALEAGYKVEP